LLQLLLVLLDVLLARPLQVNESQRNRSLHRLMGTTAQKKSNKTIQTLLPELITQRNGLEFRVRPILEFALSFIPFCPESTSKVTQAGK
jgi:hypothetical protein